MPYTFDAKQTVPENLIRTVSEQIDRAIAELCDKSLDPPTAVHQARKRIKKIRGVLRLAREEMGELYVYENLLFRDAGRRLADIRDAQAALETFDKLSQKYPAHFRREACHTVRKGLEEGLRKVAGNKAYVEQVINDVVDMLRHARKRLKSWPLSVDHYSALSKGHRKTYRKGRRLFARVYNEPTPENLHELRKAVKYHWYHGRLLRGTQTKRMARYNASVKRMADLLGEHHDMAALRSMLLKHPERYGTYHEIRGLFKLLDRTQEELWRQAEPLGRLIFLEKPKYIERRMLEDWEGWKAAQAQKASVDVDAELSAAGMTGESLIGVGEDVMDDAVPDVSEKGELAASDKSRSSQPSGGAVAVTTE
ncbi:MAG: CHAD domain-containing protein [Pseudomonadota bacterium]